MSREDFLCVVWNDKSEPIIFMIFSSILLYGQLQLMVAMSSRKK
jgi:hypothetical protein